MSVGRLILHLEAFLHTFSNSFFFCIARLLLQEELLDQVIRRIPRFATQRFRPGKPQFLNKDEKLPGTFGVGGCESMNWRTDRF